MTRRGLHKNFFQRNGSNLKFMLVLGKELKETETDQLVSGSVHMSFNLKYHVRWLLNAFIS